MSAILTPRSFVAEYYLDEYADVRRKVGAKNWNGAWNHYRRFGVQEGRSPNPFFKPQFYRDKYSDIRRTYHKDYPRIALHWLTHGIKEGRQGSGHFDARYYLSHYPDLQKAFGATGYARCFEHFVTSGCREGRVPSAEAYEEQLEHMQCGRAALESDLRNDRALSDDGASLRVNPIIAEYFITKYLAPAIEYVLDYVFGIPEAGRGSGYNPTYPHDPAFDHLGDPIGGAGATDLPDISDIA